MSEPTPAFVVIDTYEGLDVPALEAKLGIPVVAVRPGTRVELYEMSRQERKRDE